LQPTTEEKALEAVQQLVAKLQAFESAMPVIACKEVLEALGAKAEASREELVQIIAVKDPGRRDQAALPEVARLTKEIAQLKQVDLVQLALKQGKPAPMS
jgi:hypothetical protein